MTPTLSQVARMNARVWRDIEIATGKSAAGASGVREIVALMWASYAEIVAHAYEAEAQKEKTDGR